MIENKLCDLADLFKIFSDSTRIKIMYALLKKEMCVTEISNALNMNQSAISHQLRILKKNNLLASDRRGKTNVYRLNDNHVTTIIKYGLEHIEENEEYND